MTGLEHYNFTYKDGRPLEEFKLEFVIFHQDDFTDDVGNTLKGCRDLEEIVQTEGEEWMKELF